MTSINKRIFTVFVFVTLFLVNPVSAEQISPQKTVSNLLTAIKGLKKGEALTAEEKKTNETLKDEALAILDVGFVSRKALGKHWKKRTPKEQKEFVALLGQLFRSIAFPNSSKFFAELEIQYGESVIEDDKAIVPITVVHQDEGEIEIDFKLHHNSSPWTVYDVILDGVSMRNNLRTQFYKVIKSKDYADLYQRMETKLKEAVDE